MDTVFSIVSVDLKTLILHVKERALKIVHLSVFPTNSCSSCP